MSFLILCGLSFERGLALAIDMKYYHRKPMDLGSNAASKKIDRISFHSVLLFHFDPIHLLLKSRLPFLT